MSHKILRLFLLSILLVGLMIVVAPPAVRAAGPWYVATTGDDGHDCLSPSTPCATINGAMGKASNGDTVNVAEGSYPGSGSEVVLIDKNITLVGGWDSSFSVQNGMSIIDGENSRKGFTINNGVLASIDRFTVQFANVTGNGGGGIFNSGSLTVTNSIISNNTSGSGTGSAIYNTESGTLAISNGIIRLNGSDQICWALANYGILSMDNSLVEDNTSSTRYCAQLTLMNGSGTMTLTETIIRNNLGGLYNYASAILKNSVISSNAGVQGAGDGPGGIYNWGGSLVVINSTISGNATSSGGGIFTGGGGIVRLNNATLSANTATTGGGIYNHPGSPSEILMQNTILAGNIASIGVDCNGTISSSGYNLVGNTSDCGFTASTGDLSNLDARLGMLVGSPAYHPLISDSPAIDAGNPTGCADQDGNPLPTDQRGVARVGICDIGAYEYTTPGPAANLMILSGDAQRTITTLPFPAPLQVMVLDGQGSPVEGVTINFTAPETGPSGTFADTGTNTTAVSSNGSGVGITSVFTANEQVGSYVVSASAAGLGSVNFNFEQVGRPANDDFANAEIIAALPFNDSVDITNATLELNEPAYCGSTDQSRSVWYSFTPSTGMVVSVDMLGSSFSDTNLTLYRSVGPGFGGLSLLRTACSSSSMNFNVQAGTTYYLQAENYNSGGGDLHLNLQQIPPPANDSFAEATVITSLPISATVDMVGATTEPNEAFNCSYSLRSVWYAFAPTENMAIRLDMVGSQVGGAAGIYQANGPSIADLSPVACAYTFNGGSSNMRLAAGQIYYLQIISNDPGVLQFHLEQITPPANDNFADAEVINGFPFNATANNTDATTEPGEPQNCSFPFRSLWYTFTPTENMALQLDAYNQFGASASIFVDNGTGLSGLTSLTCAFTGPGNLRNFQVDAGTKYYLRLDTFGQPGTIDVNLQQLTPPANDRFDGAEEIASLPFSVALDNTSASMELGETSVCGFPFRSVWYAFTPSETMVTRIQNTSQLYGAIDIFRADGPGIADLTFLGCAFDGRSTNIQLEAGETYFLRVDSNGTPGILQFNFEQIFPPGNDDFANAELITALPFNSSADNSSATAQLNEPIGCAFPTRTLWYSFTPTENTAVRANITGGTFGSAVDVYVASGSTFADLTFIGCASNGVAKNFRLEAGKTYYLRLDSVVEPGLLQLSLEQIVPPANDDFVNAELIGSLPFSATIDNTNATSEPGEQFGCGGVGKSVWYSFTPTENILVRLHTAGGGSSGNVSAFLATGPSISDLTFLTCAGNTSVFLQLEAGKTYYLRLDSFSQGEILQVNLVPSVPPVNDNIASATAATSLPFTATVDITDATYEFSEPQNCYNMLQTVWYSFTPTETMTLRADTLGSPINGNVNIYRSTGPGFSGLQFLNCSGPSNSALFLAEAGETYYLQVGSSSGQTGTVNVSLVQTAPPENDNLSNATSVTSLPFTATVDITDATNEPGEPQYCNFTPNTIWYSFTPSTTTKVRADTMGSAISGNVSIYQASGNGFPGLQILQCTGLGGATTLLAEAGQTYYFQVGGTGQAGTIQFNLTEVPVITGRITDAVTGAPLPGDMEPFATARLYRICGGGCLEFVNSTTANGAGQFLFDSYFYGAPLLVGSYQIEVTADLYATRSFGPFEFSGSNLDVGDLPLVPPAEIRGRAVDAVSGVPLVSASVTLRRCDAGVCMEYVNQQYADSNGQFRFNSFYYGLPLPDGTYELEISAVLHDIRRLQVTIADSASRDLGDVLVDPTPLIGSISGRLVDAATGRPIDLIFSPQLYLLRCDSNGCFNVNNMSPDSAGRFRFETDYSGNHLITGTYHISYGADQYFPNQTNTFDVGVNMNRAVGDIRLTSFPVRFSNVAPCADIPSSGGDCNFTVKVWNGTARNLSGKAWSLANTDLPSAFAGWTHFQIRDPQDLSIAKGKTRVFSFRLSVPANASPYGTYLCTRIFVGEGSQAFFNTLGFRDLFCVIRNATGYSIASPQTTGLQTPVSATAQTGMEAEPNNSCQSAQDVGAVSGQFIMDGLLDSSQSPDVDFFRFTGTPGAVQTIDLLGASFGNGTLGDPLLGFFDSNCNIIAFNDDSGSLNSRLEIVVPADGSFIMAATAYPDYGFVGGGNGSYQLMVTPVTYLGSIRGVVTDAARGNPLSGAAAPFAYVRLLRCDTFGCFDVNSQAAGRDGSFRFETDSTGAALRVGDYMIIASADQYQYTQTAQFTVGEAEDYDAGRIALASHPVRFSDTQVCSVPSAGGLCEFSVKVTNGLATRFSGKAWSIIGGYGIGSFADFTNFQTDTPLDVSLGSGKSVVLRFRFHVPASVPNGAYICATAFVGQNPNALFNTSGLRTLFCFVKGSNGFTLLSEQEMQAYVQQMQVLTPPQPDVVINKQQ